MRHTAGVTNWDHQQNTILQHTHTQNSTGKTMSMKWANIILQSLGNDINWLPSKEVVKVQKQNTCISMFRG